MLVYVLNKYKKPLMPCSSRKARMILKNGKAKVACHSVFDNYGFSQPKNIKHV